MPIIVLRKDVIEEAVRLLVILRSEYREGRGSRNGPEFGGAAEVTPAATDGGHVLQSRFLTHPQPIQRIFVQIEQRNAAEHPARRVEADARRRELMKPGFEVIHASFHAVYVKPEVSVKLPMVVANLEQLSAVMEGEFIV